MDLNNVELGVKLRAYDCTVSPTGVLTQGMVIRVCIEPIQEAIMDGFRMNAIEWFTYSKISQNITQEAVVDQIQAPNELTRLSCVQGTSQCVVETMLFGAFFSGNGTVEASGLATMQLGTHSSDNISQQGRQRQRSLLRGQRSDSSSNRMLQAASETVSKEFDIPFEVVATTKDGDHISIESTSSFLSGSNNNDAGGSKTVTILIILLAISNTFTLFVLIFQHSFFRRTWFCLE